MTIAVKIKNDDTRKGTVITVYEYSEPGKSAVLRKETLDAGASTVAYVHSGQSIAIFEGAAEGAERAEWAELFDAQASMIAYLRGILEQVRSEDRDYNFGSKLRRIVDTALANAPQAPAVQVAQRAATEGGVAPTLSGAEGEIARLREALEKIRDHSPIPTSIYNIARAALGAP